MKTEPNTEKGSPTTIPRTTSGMYGTADEQSTAGDIKSPQNKRTVIIPGTVPLDRLPQAISKEIHTYGGLISGIIVQRIDQDGYAISLINRIPKVRSPKTDADSSPRGDGHAD
ncbi:hypothetical protein L0665_06090 [Methanogenium marinum]|uniref:Uncharacterized protein n=1 Tax=Methanogenium marinum TaxID=348610 RepID=A0A9Q4KPH6_9EURY|nr:hypothetical protein [Methanogenium marinum]MDE4908178.1 hypothetical protein [Methanogenium marinum]